MGKRIFEICGNFEQNGRYAEPSPSFVGLLAVDENDRFVGYCKELYESNQPEENRLRFLCGGFFGVDHGHKGIVFLKLSNFTRQKPLLYGMADLQKEESGKWLSLYIDDGGIGFDIQGGAIVTTTEKMFSDEEYQAILDKYSELDEREKALADYLNDQFRQFMDYIVQ